ncbi:MAG: rod shape-determining protein RodA [Alphaproteobacteria bacterium]|nr:rod shape-determining protein RodA [Alphaproteobacteria bacterium]
MSVFSVTNPLRFRKSELSLKDRFKNISWFYILIVALIAGIGFVTLYSVANGSMEPWAKRQLVRFAFGVGVIVFIAMTDLRVWIRYAYVLYTLVLLLLIYVELFGHDAMGAQRWINLGFIQLQPSELMKIALVLALARFFHGTSLHENENLKTLIVPLILVAMPVILVMKQPDLGTAVMLSISAGVVFFLVGVQIWKFGVVGLLGLLSLPIAWNFFLHDYQKQRVLTFLDPEKDPLGAGYHIIQSHITLGSGSLFGKGFLQGTQSRLNFLPEKHTDFIFTVFAEEFGMMGAFFLLALYVLLIIFGFYIALRCTSFFGKLLALGLTANLFFYVFINVAMVMGLVPVVGVPLPLISYGGTAMLTHMISFGLIQCVYVNKDIPMGRSGAAPEN